MWDSSKSAIDNIGQKLESYAALMKGDVGGDDNNHHETITEIYTKHFEFLQELRISKPDVYCILIQLSQKILDKPSNYTVKCTNKQIINFESDAFGEKSPLETLINLLSSS